MISQTAEYALRAVVYLSYERQSPCTTAEIALAIDAPSSFLAKVMQGLGRAGVVASQRGPSGGFTLTRDPDDLTVLDVVTAVDAFHRIEECPLGKPAHTSGLCPLHRRLDNVIATAERTLETTTISELLEEPNLLCSLPCISEQAATAAASGDNGRPAG